jgi:DNA-binding transcriptional LysR family regulator
LIKDNSVLRLYMRVARLGSFSAAARECGLSQSQASRAIADLEAELGVRLLSRTTRAVVPTEAGGNFWRGLNPFLPLRTRRSTASAKVVSFAALSG